MVENVNSTKSKPTIEIVPDLLESEASALTANPPTDDVHDCSENENNAANKRSVKNVLYEQGRTWPCIVCMPTLSYNHTVPPNNTCSCIPTSTYLPPRPPTHLHTHLSLIHI